MVVPSHSSTEAVAPRLPIDPHDLIAGLGRGLAVIESFDDGHPRMTVAEVATRTGIPRSAARRHLLSLCHFGYADSDGKRFWLAPRVLRLGQSYLEAARLPRLVQPFIQRLSLATGETVNVSLLDGHEVVYVARSNSPRVVSIGFYAGARVPAHVVGPGTVLLAAWSDDALQSWVAAHEFSAFTASTVVDRDAFLEQVRVSRGSDAWISRGRLDPGLVGVAVRLTDRRGEVRAAIGMTLQAAFWDDARIAAELIPALQETAGILRPLL
ncbi:helix-turn-helix domain-containing protein [Hydrogenophaga sp. PBL-H3]|uniref:IclR family transcriptional regulator domain-containing protein n=1 Tax=Hydrogenophaga sp. PBL-H3 TaxID=434010 RepID=UPI00131F4A0A|nr:IclR family transcriptional regulator C-terminal domain-containing protein [Hydrogenophaga sp. PBL-H3]QHE77122.1 helix-turn-helix domain-containing protein [Hydrogenophaga sp. PBL-H3]QHE81546.1 helix-turn-helix domain-containing protein [Hydrogenophaga sp. PBL-H3]